MTDHEFHPDGLTVDAITTLQRDVNRELRREGYPIRYGDRPTAQRPAREPVEPAITPTSTPSRSSASPLCVGHGRPGEQDTADRVRPPADHLTGDPARILFTPAQAADLLQVPESWLRRRVARRLVPCTFLGKHLRFSHTNLDQIIADAARPAATAGRAGSDTGAARRRRGRPPARARTDSHRPTR